MDASSLIGHDALATGLQKQAGAQAAALQGATRTASNLKQVQETGQKFEAFFIGQMMEHMSAGIATDPTFGGGHGEDMWKSMMNQEYGKEIAKSGRLGIADQVVKSMLKMQEDRTAAAQAALGAPAAPGPDPNAGMPEQGPAMAEQSQHDAAIAMVAGTRMPVRR